MFDYNTFMRAVDHLKNEEIGPAWRFEMSPRTHKRLQYFAHVSVARLMEPRYKRRKCSIRRLTARRQAARKLYGV